MAIEGSKTTTARRRLRLGMVGGGEEAFIGAVHRIASRMDDHYELVAGCFASTAERSKSSAAALRVAPERAYGDFASMAKAEAARSDGIDAVAIVTPNHLHVPVAEAFIDAGIHVICDKPLTTNLDDAERLAAKVEASGLLFVLTHNYTGYPLIRQAKDMVDAGELGAIRVVQVEYPQDWLSTPLEETGQKQADWRTDPERSGPVGCLGDIGTHVFNLARFVTGLGVEQLFAELTTFVDGRRLDDNAQVLLRFKGGARGAFWASQVAPGNENALKLRVYGEKAGLVWAQEDPNVLTLSPLGEQPRRLTRGGPGLGDAAGRVTRVPPGHPEGYLEGFANLYSDAALRIHSRLEGKADDPATTWLPNVADGVEGVRFIARCLESSKAERWVEF